MRIAMGSTHGPEIVNLQLGLWRHAVEQFRRLELVGSGPPSYLLSEPRFGEYSENEFSPDAAVAVVLAGTSVTVLIGQNTKLRRHDGGIDGFWKCVKDVLGLEKGQISKEFQEFYDLYECLKHFGEPHYDRIYISPEELCEYMRTAQEFWIRVLNHLGMSVPAGLFDNEFKMEYELE